MLMTTAKPLNRQLYQLLETRFGDVRIASPGIGFRGRVRKVFTGSKLVDRYMPDVAGEYYLINCPYCNDTRHRLWINHMFGMPDPANPPNGVLMHFAVCYNEGCLSLPGRAVDFESLVFGHINRNQRRKIVVARGADEATTLTEVSLPGIVLPLTRLPADSAVVAYLEDRGFDREILVRDYDVGYCVDSDMYPICVGRIIIPITMNGELVGWQARHPEDLDWKASRIPKYYGMPGMPKRLMLYNYDTASQFKTGVLVEGVTDVWKIGNHCVGLLGKKLHPKQRRLLAEFSSLIVMLDGDAAADVESIKDDLLRMYDGRVGFVELSGETDPGSLTKEQNWELIYEAADSAGITEHELRAVRD